MTVRNPSSSGGGGSSPYNTFNVYTALLSQSAGAPTAIILQNTLGGVPVLTQAAIGEYNITLANAFPAAKTFLTIQADGDFGGSSPAAPFYEITRISDSVIKINTFVNDSGNIATDALLANTSVEIRVYP